MDELKTIFYKGLTDDEVSLKRKISGANKLTYKKRSVKDIVRDIGKEPMLIILLGCTVIYFLTGQNQEGIIMICAITLVSSISFFQEQRSNKAIKSLAQIASPESEVLRNGKIVALKIEELVKDDVILIKEGQIVPADIKLVQGNDISTDESLLTGESLPVTKSLEGNPFMFKGTYVISGQGLAIIDAVGNFTRIGQIGKSMEGIVKDLSPLQHQVARFVKYMAIAGILSFILIFTHHFLEDKNFLKSLLSGLTIAMSIFPEEIPVAITIFMALGAWAMIQDEVLVKEPKTLETLGSTTVICVDKTGTLTENRMSLKSMYVYKTSTAFDVAFFERSPEAEELLSYAMWSSEPVPFDPMEKAIHEAYEKNIKSDLRNKYKFIHEYPLAGSPPSMTHIFEGKDGERIVACKGGPETIFKFCYLNNEERLILEEQVKRMASEGMRILAVAKAEFRETVFPKEQKNFKWKLLGIIGLSDPPKRNMPETVSAFYKAGIEIKMITGDIAETASAIAKKIGINSCNVILTGKQILEMTEPEICKAVIECNVFARMFPEAKLKIINALKKNGEVVTMTGDGINDAPALKASHIGVAMGKKGSQVAKDAASIILMKDDLSKIIIAIAYGRKIYSNLKKAILYIVSIHIPIIGIMLLPLLMEWNKDSIFSPVHIIFLELLMAPICSVAFEREPMDDGLMTKKPRRLNKDLFSGSELITSVIQGITILIGLLFMFYYSMNEYDETITRTSIFITLVTSNIALALTDRSREKTMFQNLKVKNNTLYALLLFGIACLFFILKIDFLRVALGLTSLSFIQIILCISAALLSVGWFDVWKALKKQSD